ncbi:MAG: protein-L-isoaspartate O-methyltransferase [Acetobacter sp.]|nr:protein-L-isoaspartate O-methyltransferase [Acetobacter sp.]
MPVSSAFETARRNMLFGQLICNRIQDTALLNAMGSVPRERFVPDRMQGKAYADEAIAVGRGVLFPPLMLANLIELADVRSGDFVLNTHAGTGYSAAVLAKMATAVVATEDDESLCENAEKIYIDCKIDNVAMFCRSSESGFSSQAPFDVIFIDGIVPLIPDGLANQLIEGGRLVAVVAAPDETFGQAVKIVKKDGNLLHTKAFEVDLAVLNRVRTYKKFVFEGIS